VSSSRHSWIVRIFALASIALLASCGAGGSTGDVPTQPGIGGDSPPALMPKGVAIIKFRSAGSEWVALTERLKAIEDVTAPDRQIRVASDGRQFPWPSTRRPDGR
jgi:hypothetical protein